MRPTTRTIAIAICSLLFIAITAHSQSAEDGTAGHSPPVFQDSGREQRALATHSEVDVLFQEFAERARVPGLVYAIVLDEEILYSGGFGYADVSNNIPVSNQTLFRVASMSKAITAQAILQLRDSGQLSLNDPISRYVPEATQLQQLTSDAPAITIRHLLTHSAGLPEDNAWGDRQLAMSDEAFRSLIEQGVPFSTVAGTQYEYSNVGYSLLGQIIQNVSGQSFESYTTQHIFEPLNMNATVWEYEDADPDDLAKGYKIEEGEHIEESLEHHGAFGPMAGLITSIEDFAKYAALHLSAWPPRNGEDTGPLQRSSLREMQQPHRLYTFSSGSCAYVLAYAFGLNWAQECDTPPYVTHNGGLPGFGSNWVMVPEYGLAVISFTNRTYMAPLFTNVDVVQRIIEEAGLEPRELPVSPILEQRRQALLAVLPDLSGAEKSGIFADNFFQDNNIDAYRNEVSSLFNQIGPIRRTLEIEPENQLRGTFQIEGENGILEVFFSLTPESEPKIQSLELEMLEPIATN